MTAAALALTGVGLAGFVACSAAYGFVGARHSHAYLQVFDVAFKAWGLAALFLPVPAYGAIVLASRGEPWRVFLVAPLLWVAGGVTVWNLGLAFVLV